MAVKEMLHEVLREDAWWRDAWVFEDYACPWLDYEDYAPAYCVGYAGWHQYGGQLQDAQRCLWANWERLRGGSRLTHEQAWPAICAAWDRARRGQDAPSAEASLSMKGACPVEMR